MLNRHCVGFFRVAVFTSRVVWKWNYHRICSESTFMKQDVSHQNSLETCFYRLLKHKYGLFLQQKRALTQNAK